MAVIPAATNRHETYDKINYRILAPVGLTAFAGMLRFTAFAPFMPQIASEVDSSVAIVAQVTTGTLIMAAITGLFSGPLADYYGHRRVLVIGLAIVTISTLLIAIAPNLEVLLIAGLVTGFGGAMTHPVGFAIAASRFRGDAQRKALSVTQAMTTSANILGIPLLTGIAYFALWRGAFVFLTALLAIALVLVYRLLPWDGAIPESRMEFGSLIDAYRPLLSDRPTVMILISVAVRAFGFSAPVMFSAAYLQEELGFSLQEVGLTMMISGAGIFLGTMITGSRLGGFGLRPLFFFSCLILAASWSAIYVAPLGPYLIVILFAIGAVSAGVGYTSQLALLASISPAGPGTTMSFQISVFTATMAVATGIGGVILSVAGYSALGVIFPAFIIVAAFMLWQPAFVVARSPQKADAV